MIKCAIIDERGYIHASMYIVFFTALIYMPDVHITIVNVLVYTPVCILEYFIPYIHASGVYIKYLKTLYRKFPK